MISAAGIVFVLLVLMALAAVIIFFGRFFDLRRAQIDYEDFLKGVINVMESGNVEEALAICEDTVAPVSSVVATAIRHQGGSARVLREAVDSQGRAEVGRLDRRLASLAIMAQVAPLLGLFGTVVGLVRTVRVANAAELVSRAMFLDSMTDSLICAAFGLAVAILTTIMYGALRVRLDRIVVDLEAAASQIIGCISSIREREAMREKERVR